MTTNKQTRKLRNTGGLLWKLMLVALLIWLLRPPVVLASPSKKPDSKRVLAIFVFKHGLPWAYSVERGMRAAFASESAYPVELDVEHADRSRFPEEAFLDKLVELYRYKYSRRKMDLVVAVGDESTELLLAYGEELFGNIPVVLVNSSRQHLLNEIRKPHITSLLWGLDIKKTVQIIQDVRPQTKNIFIISGASVTDENTNTRAIEALRENAAELNIESLKDLTIDNLLKKVRNLPEDSAILFLSYFRDATGKYFVPREILSQISEIASAPTFGIIDTYLGQGIVGGCLLSAGYQGNVLANIAVDLLKGKPINDAESIPKDNLPMFDWRQLKRWGIDEKRLPPGSTVRYRERSIWEDHKGKIIGVGIIILAQAFAVAHLLMQRKKRSRAEEESQRLRDELAHISRVLAMGEIAASLAHELNQPLTAIQSYAQAAERFLA